MWVAVHFSQVCYTPAVLHSPLLFLPHTKVEGRKESTGSPIASPGVSCEEALWGPCMRKSPVNQMICQRVELSPLEPQEGCHRGRVVPHPQTPPILLRHMQGKEQETAVLPLQGSAGAWSLAVLEELFPPYPMPPDPLGGTQGIGDSCAAAAAAGLPGAWGVLPLWWNYPDSGSLLWINL